MKNIINKLFVFMELLTRLFFFSRTFVKSIMVCYHILRTTRRIMLCGSFSKYCLPRHGCCSLY